MIKKFYASVVFLAVFCISATALFAQEDGSGEFTTSFQILGSMSLGYASNSNLNDVASKSGDDDVVYYNAYPLIKNTFSAENSTADFTYGFDLDLRYFFGNVGIGAEVGYHIAEAKSEVTSSVYSASTTTTIGIAVIPVVATLFYRVPMESSSNFILIGGGLGYYSGTLKYKYEDDSGVLPDLSSSIEGKQSTIGYHALVEYDYVMESGLTFYTGLKARYVHFNEFDKDGSPLMYNGKNLEASLTGVNWYFGAGFSI
jgi:hypothetical protein